MSKLVDTFYGLLTWSIKLIGRFFPDLLGSVQVLMNKALYFQFTFFSFFLNGAKIVNDF